ncbi:DNA endonuclease SmrA [Endozoicomonas gorgoniicola]|uniref:DNA endonuclease SmrA n=1 Tax=Endozoicomonas gorgoniicola TaxID=1234144 RepID=A0ABT3MQ22_9GAMM|nr:DNA endonuclease SmrA [Endozoicomonas gorgoniicola]MCW7551470.1 DNA endonuclease SmrA [Endozoicomonas gorgoniicola]
MSLEDHDLFLQEMQGVTPIKQSVTADIQKSHRETPGQRQRRHAAQQELSDPNFLSLDNPRWVKPHDHLEYKKSGVQTGVFKKLRLAKYDNEARLDLYQHTVKEARAAIFQFINDCTEHELRNVLIVHGRGHNSSPPAKMKSYVNTWLREFDQVLSFHTALREHGGSGAVYVSLRKSEREKLENRERHAKRQS